MRAGDGYPRRRTWWIAPFLGGAFAVLAVAAILQLTVLRHTAGKAPYTATARAPRGRA